MGLKFFRYWSITVLLLAIAVRLAYVLFTGFADEDGYITFRYAHMLVEGQGFVFNPTEHVYGTTTPLFTLLIAGWLFLSLLDPLLGSRIIGIAASLGTIACTVLSLRRIRLDIFTQVLGGLTLALSTRLIPNDTSGMEISLVLFFMAASWLASIKSQYRLAGFLTGLLLWTRIDTVIWLVVLAVIISFENQRGLFRFVVIAGLTYLPWLIFATLYFGSPIPHTIIAKQIAYVDYNISSLIDHFRVVLGYLSPLAISLEKRGLIFFMMIFTVGVAVWSSWANRNKRPLWPLGIFALIEIIRLTLTRSTYFDRYMVPTLWAVLILAASGLGELWNPQQLPSRNSMFYSAVGLSSIITIASGILGRNSLRFSPIGDLVGDYLLLILWIILVLFFWNIFAYFQHSEFHKFIKSDWRTPFSIDRLRKSILLGVLILILVAGVQNFPSLIKNARDTQFYRNQSTLKAIGVWMNQNSSSDATVLLEPIGYIGYYSERVLWDEVGLVTPHITNLKQKGQNDPYFYLQDMKPDYVIQHCYDIVRWKQRDKPESNLLLSLYHFEKKFDPLNFDPNLSYDPIKNFYTLSQLSCYEIWMREKK